jgi:uncharacterized protein (UPF0332 family)
MQSNETVLINNCIEKSERALKSADNAINNDDVDTAFNRIYYTIFYSVMALGYKYSFVTSKHGQLIGWFNRKFIYEDKIFPIEMYEIYKVAFNNRQESDYNLLSLDKINKQEAILTLEKAKIFFENVKNHLSKI